MTFAYRVLKKHPFKTNLLASPIEKDFHMFWDTYSGNKHHLDELM